jgi:uncharacterized protein (DUF1810 family)
METGLNRFLKAQENDYLTALSEIKAGRKRSHWMWYIFPQVKGLGFSETSKFYAIKDIEEAVAYLKHPVLGKRLKEITSELLKLHTNNASEVFGSPDDMKIKSSLTLFAAITDETSIFREALQKFFGGKEDEQTLRILGVDHR